MVKTVRFSLCVIAVVQFFFAVAFFWQLPFAVNLWPFPGTTPLTFIFISSIFAAAAAPTLWAAATENYGVLVGIGLDYMGILLPVAFLSFQLGAAGDSAMIIYGIACIFGALFGLGLLWSLRFPVDRSLPMPGFVRWSFVFFIFALAIVSFRLITKVVAVGASGLRSIMDGAACCLQLTPSLGTQSTRNEKASDVSDIGATRFWQNYSPDWDTGQTAQTAIYFTR